MTSRSGVVVWALVVVMTVLSGLRTCNPNHADRRRSRRVQTSYHSGPKNVPARFPRPWQTGVMATYDEYCPIAVGVEFFGDRWTPLILRELVVGSHRFNEIHRGIPKISRTLLSQRLRALVDRGIVERVDDDYGIEYHLTPAGAALQPIIWSLGHWAA